MFLKIETREHALALGIKQLKEAGYEVVLRKAKDRGTRVWMIVEKDKLRPIALLVLADIGEEGWMPKLFHENFGIPRLNCPLSIFREIGFKSRSKKAREWRLKAEAMMQNFADRSHQIRLMKKRLGDVPYSEIKKMMTEKIRVTRIHHAEASSEQERGVA